MDSRPNEEDRRPVIADCANIDFFFRKAPLSSPVQSALKIPIALALEAAKRGSAVVPGPSVWLHSRSVPLALSFLQPGQVDETNLLS